MKLNLNKGDRICFFGDSITHGGFWIKEIFEFFKTNYKELEIGMYNCGVAGSKGYEANIKNRMFADLFNFFPKYVVVMFGMNDAWPWLYSPNNTEPDKVEKREGQIKIYPESLEFIIDMCKKCHATPIICSPTPYDEYSDDEGENWHADIALKKCADIAKETAKKHGLIYIDMRKTILDNINKNPIRKDRVHPNEFGHHLMAEAFLCGIGAKDKIEPDVVCEYSDINNERFIVEQKLRLLEQVDRDIMLWQYEEDKPLEERKKLVAERQQERKDLGDELTQGYITNLDYRNVILGELVRLTFKMYE